MVIIPGLFSDMVRDSGSAWLSGWFITPEITRAAENRDALLYGQNNLQQASLIEAARNLDPNPSRGGGDVRIVDQSALAAQENPQGLGIELSSKQSSSDQIAVYVVREGDTLSQIADMYDIDPNTIRWANDISVKGVIAPGDTLIILPVNGLRHTIKKGETLAGIVKTYGADIDEVRVFNGLTGQDELTVGAIITIPGGEMPAPVTKGTARAASSGSPATSAGSSLGSNDGGWLVHPVPGAVRTQGHHGYNAVDFGAAIGSTVRAAAAGRVIVSRSGGWNGGYGSYVVIDHGNGVQTLYAHLSSNAVSQGQAVSRGQAIGGLGNTGRSTGPHLHFEVRGAGNPF